MAEDALGAARDALERQDWQAAHDLVLDVAPSDDLLTDADRTEILAEAYWWLGRLDDCIAAREMSVARFEEAGDNRRAGECAVYLWEHNSISARPVIAGSWLRRARRLLDGDEQCTAHAALLLREAEVAHGERDLDRAMALAKRALDTGRALRSADIEAEALQTVGRILIDEGDLREGMGHLDEAMLLALQGRLRPFSAGKVYCSMIAACEEVDDFDRAAEWTEATLRWSARHPFAIWPGICRVHRAVVLKRRGSLAEAEVEASRASTELAQSHRGAGIAALVEIGDIRRRLGDLDRSEEAFGTALERGGGTCGPLALLRLAQGRLDEARSIVTGCLRGTAKRLDRAALLPIQVQVAIVDGELEIADSAVAELEDIVAVYGTHALEATLLSTRGRLELAHGDSAAACNTLQQAVDGWSKIDALYEVATAQTLLGQALRAEGHDAEAAATFADAAARFDRIGAHLDTGEALGSGATKHVLPAGLSDREVEVLRLVAAGRTNVEIATELYLSPKTVSRHVSNIFTKIGVNSRASATAFAYEHDLVN